MLPFPLSLIDLRVLEAYISLFCLFEGLCGPSSHMYLSFNKYITCKYE